MPKILTTTRRKLAAIALASAIAGAGAGVMPAVHALSAPVHELAAHVACGHAHCAYVRCPDYGRQWCYYYIDGKGA